MSTGCPILWDNTGITLNNDVVRAGKDAQIADGRCAKLPYSHTESPINPCRCAKMPFFHTGKEVGDDLYMLLEVNK